MWSWPIDCSPAPRHGHLVTVMGVSHFFFGAGCWYAGPGVADAKRKNISHVLSYSNHVGSTASVVSGRRLARLRKTITFSTFWPFMYYQKIFTFFWRYVCSCFLIKYRFYSQSETIELYTKPLMEFEFHEKYER